MARIDGFAPARARRPPAPRPTAALAALSARAFFPQSAARPRMAVIVATMGRPAQVGALLARLARQWREPDLIVLSAPDASHLPAACGDPRQRRVFGPPGLCAQRNRALDALAGGADIVTFFDDDFVPADDYLLELEAAFADHPDWRVAMGHVLLDGAVGPGVSQHEAELALEAARRAPPAPREEIHPGAYGCNMSARAQAIGAARFDERLALYGWQEDIDFSARAGRGGRIVLTTRLLGVHLGVKSGRVSGLRFGYSQIANPVYLTRKGTMPAPFAARLMARNVAANLARALRPEPFVDRRGRLKGNLVAALDVLRGRITPERILNL
jgi:hypothetical protein